MDKYLQIEKAFEEKADIENAVKMSKYMRDKFKFYGLSTPNRKEIYKELLKAEKKNGIVDWDFLDLCYENEHREFQYLVMDYLVAMQKFLKFDDVPHICLLYTSPSPRD